MPYVLKQGNFTRNLAFKLGGTIQNSRLSRQLGRGNLGCNTRLQYLKSACISVYMSPCALLNPGLSYLGAPQKILFECICSTEARGHHWRLIRSQETFCWLQKPKLIKPIHEKKEIYNKNIKIDMNGEWMIICRCGSTRRKSRSRAVRMAGVNSTEVLIAPRLAKLQVPSTQTHSSQNTQMKKAPRLKQNTGCIMRRWQNDNGQDWNVKTQR